MTDFYVDGTNGSDAYDGTVPDWTSGTIGPKATIQGCLNAINGSTGLANGDVVWIAPGTYRHNSAELDIIAGTLTSLAYIKGDPDCTKAWDSTIKQGIIRITRCDTNEQPTAGVVIDMNGEANVEIWDVQIDGVEPLNTTTNRTVDGDPATSGQKLVRCVVMSGYWAAYGVSIESCALFGSYFDWYSGNANKTAKRSLLLSPNYQKSFGTNAGALDCCIFMRGDNVSYGTIKNSLFIGCTHQSVGDGYDRNVHLCANHMGRGELTYPAEGTIGICCQNDAYSTEAPDLSSDYRLSICDVNATANGGTDPTNGHAVICPPAMQILAGLEQAFKMRLTNFTYGNGTETSETIGANKVDLAVRARGEASTKKYFGPWGLSDKEWTYDATDGRTIKIHRTGNELLRIPIKKATAVTISLQCEWSIDGGTTYPQIELLRENDGGSMTSLGTDTIVGGDSQGHTLSIALTTSSVTDKDILATLVLKSRETTTNAYASFYNLQVT